MLTVARSGGAGTPAFGILSVLFGANATISGLTLSGGSDGIGNGGTLHRTLDISDNGGTGITNTRTATVIGLDDQRQRGHRYRQSGTATVVDSTIGGNSGEQGAATGSKSPILARVAGSTTPGSLHSSAPPWSEIRVPTVLATSWFLMAWVHLVKIVVQCTRIWRWDRKPGDTDGHEFDHCREPCEPGARSQRYGRFPGP